MGMALKSTEREFQLLDIEGRRVEATSIKMNKKADKKLGAVADMFCQVLPDNCEVIDSDMLYRRLRVSDLAPLYDVMLVYDVENRFAAISYNLLVQSVVRAREERYYSFELKLDGTIRTKSMRFEKTNDDRWPDHRERQLLGLLNEPIVLGKIQQLGLLGVSLRYQLEYGRWLISVRSMVGSSTWILMPPVMQVIMPVRQEVYQFMELMRMLTSILQGGDRDDDKT